VSYLVATADGNADPGDRVCDRQFELQQEA
jgi:hypothetical protein